MRKTGISRYAAARESGGAMAELSKLILGAKSLIVPTLFIGGMVVGLLGIACLVFGGNGVMVGLLLIFGGVAAVAMAQLLELLMVIADHLELLMVIAGHLAAIRSQVGKGVFGLLG
jgi:hypothetical protein